jgi:tetratricopeptide (TPR) repeat protein
MWAYYFLAKHFDYRRQFGRAMDYIEKAIEHTPTLMELLMCKARIFKHQNDVEKAAEWMEEARELDTADRYVNCKSAKYLLRANKVEEASDVCGKFTRVG